MAVPLVPTTFLEPLEDRTLCSAMGRAASVTGTYDYSGGFRWKRGDFVTAGTQSGTVRVTNAKVSGRSDATDDCVSLYRITLSRAPTLGGRIGVTGTIIDKCDHGTTRYVIRSGFVRFRSGAGSPIVTGRLISFAVSGPDAGGTLTSNFTGPRQ